MRRAAPYVQVVCVVHGAQHIEPIAPVGPTLTRPGLPVLTRLAMPERLFDADPGCDHYITYRGWDGVMCVRCRGWYCA